MQAIAPLLRFAGQAGATEFYVSIFVNSRIHMSAHYGQAGLEQHGQLPGTAMTVEVDLDANAPQRSTAGRISGLRLQCSGSCIAGPRPRSIITGTH